MWLTSFLFLYVLNTTNGPRPGSVPASNMKFFLTTPVYTDLSTISSPLVIIIFITGQIYCKAKEALALGLAWVHMVMLLVKLKRKIYHFNRLKMWSPLTGPPPSPLSPWIEEFCGDGKALSILGTPAKKLSWRFVLGSIDLFICFMLAPMLVILG